MASQYIVVDRPENTQIKINVIVGNSQPANSSSNSGGGRGWI